MAIDPQAPPGPEPAEAYVSPIENELPTYRAISPLAVGSLVFGLIGVFAFADLKFVVSSALAILLGGLALWRIGKQSDVLTGAGLARAGLALGLIFGLSSLTISYTQSFLLSRRAEMFIKTELVPVLNSRNLDECLWFRLSPTERRGLSPKQVRSKFSDPAHPDPMSFEMAAGPIVPVVKVLEAQPQAKVVFDRIERTTYDGIIPVVQARLTIQGYQPDPKNAASDDPAKSSIGLVLKKQGDGKDVSWWVQEYLYPYKADSYEPKIKSIEEEHGHGH